jgi:hypothetical protein
VTHLRALPARESRSGGGMFEILPEERSLTSDGLIEGDQETRTLLAS